MDNKILGSSIFLGILSIIMLGNGITGMVSLDDKYIAKLCRNVDDCNSGESCCLFYEQDSGVCNSEDMCEAIGSMDYSIQEQPDVESDNFTAQIIVGMLIIVGLGFILYFSSRSNESRSIVHQ